MQIDSRLLPREVIARKSFESEGRCRYRGSTFGKVDRVFAAGG